MACSGKGFSRVGLQELLENLTFLWLSAGSSLVTPPWVSGADAAVLEHPAGPEWLVREERRRERKVTVPLIRHALKGENRS